MQKRFLSAKQLRERYGSVSDMTLWRWVRHPKLDFPQPVYINGRRFWAEADVDAFDERQQQQRAA